MSLILQKEERAVLVTVASEVMSTENAASDRPQKLLKNKHHHLRVPSYHIQ